MKASPVMFVFGEVENTIERGNSTGSDTRDSHPVESRQNNLADQDFANKFQERRHGEYDSGIPEDLFKAQKKKDTEQGPATKTPEDTSWGATFSNPTPSSSSASPLPSKPGAWPYPNGNLSAASRVPIPPSRSGGNLPFQPSPQEPQTATNPSEPRREVSLSISPSGLNHHSYITRQYYYGQWWPNTRTIPGDDLSQRAPLRGFSDVRLNMPEVPVRLRTKREQERHSHEKHGLRRLRVLWERGMRERGEQTRSWAQEGVKVDKGWRTVAIDDSP